MLEAMEARGTQTASWDWWHSPALASTGRVGEHQTSPPYSERFHRWRERRWVEDDDGAAWSYSMGPRKTTINVLRERFGEAGFRDAQSWQPWMRGADAGTTWQGVSGPPSVQETWFCLASPKLRLGDPMGKPQKMDMQATLNPPLARPRGRGWG